MNLFERGEIRPIRTRPQRYHFDPGPSVIPRSLKDAPRVQPEFDQASPASDQQACPNYYLLCVR